MNRTYAFIAVIVVLLISGCSSDNKQTGLPEVYLGHVDIILDTATVRAIQSDEFLTKIFAMSISDTVKMGGKPSYDLFLLGRENFFHISEARGFYVNQAGGLNIVMQSRKSGMKDSLMTAWKKFTESALEVNTSTGSGYQLDEIMPLLNWNNVIQPRIIPFVSTYSSGMYEKIGLKDSLASGVTMKTFMRAEVGPAIDNVLFKNIEELYINASEQENKILSSALLASGYVESGGTYTHKTSGKIFVNVKENGSVNKLSKMKVRLASATQPLEKTYNRLRLSIKNDEAWFYFE
jgi:hypothetical protein